MLYTDVRIFLDDYDEAVHRYPATQVPSEGEIVCVQTDKYIVRLVAWTIISGKPHADVYCEPIKK